MRNNLVISRKKIFIPNLFYGELMEVNIWYLGSKG